MSSPSGIVTVAQSSPELTIKQEVAVRSLYDSRLTYIGVVSGKDYFWNGAGDIVMVLADDVPFLLSKRIGERACCGAVQQSNKVFELVNTNGGNNA